MSSEVATKEGDDAEHPDFGVNSDDDEANSADVEEVPSNAQNTGRSSRRAVTRNLPSSDKHRTNVEYSDSDSDLGVDEENLGPDRPVEQRVRFEDDEEERDIPSDEDEEDMGDEGHEDDASPNGYLILPNAPKSSSKRQNWIKLIYST